VLVRVLGARRPWSAVGVALLVATLGTAVPAATGALPERRADGCTIVGTPGPDVLVGGPGADVICGRGGADRLVGRGGSDVLIGGDGADVLVGGDGNDSLDGGAGDDTLRGQAGNDRLTGGSGSDRLVGGAGDDSLLGLDAARFRDALDCGPGGADRAVADPRDRVGDSCERVTQNDRPTGLSLSADSVAENEPVGTQVGLLVAADPDPGDRHTFLLVAGAGSEDNASFAVDRDRLLTAATFDFETDAELTVRVRATDAAGARREQALTIVVTDVAENALPVAVDDHVNTAEDTPLSLPASGAGGPAGNDTDADGDPLTVTDVSAASGGTVSLTGATIHFTPDPNACGPASGSFAYVVSDGRGGTARGRVTVDIACTPDPAIANDDVVTVAEDAPATAINVLGNDVDADGDPVSITSATQPSHGTVVITGGGSGLTYQPNAGYCNDPGGDPADRFAYTVNGGSTATVSVRVTCVDDAPTAVDDAATVAEDAAASAVDVLVNDTDVDGGTMSVASVTQPTHGAVVITGGGTGLTYAPAADYCNDPVVAPDDTFTYTLNGGSTATVSVAVTCVDDSPLAVDDAATVTEDDAATAMDVLVNDTDVDGGTMSVASVTQPTHGAVVVTGGGTGLTYAPAADYCNDPVVAADDTFTYTLNGGSTATVSVTVTCVDDAPVAVDDTATLTEDSAATAVDVRANDTDVDAGPMLIGSVTVPGHGTVVVNAARTGLTYAPAADYCNDPGVAPDDSFTYTLDGGSTATVTVTVTCVDDAPVAVADAATVFEDAAATSVDVLTNDTDVDGGSISIASVTQPTHGAVVITGGGTGLTYAPAADYCNNPPGLDLDAFTYTLDGDSTATVRMTVTCDDPPTAVADSATVTEDAAASAVDVLVNDTDTDGGPKSVASVTQPTHGAVVITGGGTGLTYAPAANYCNNPPGSDLDSFTYTLNGGSTATVTMTVTCVDDAPVAVDDTATIAEDAGSSAVDVLDNDTDVDGGTMLVTAVTQGAHGSVTPTGGGTGLAYTPAANYCNDADPASVDTFTYTLNGGSTATVSVTVTCEDDVPVAVADAATVAEDADPTAVAVLANDTDVDAGPISITAITQPAKGIVVITGGGTGLTYEPTADYCNSTLGLLLDTFTYTLSGGSTATVSMTVTCVDDAPIAVDDLGVVFENAGTTAVDVLTNDTDIDAGPISIASVTQPSHGIVVITGGGTGLTYTPAADYCNDPGGDPADTFTYTLNGGSTATVSMTVTCDDPPTAVADSATVTEDAAASAVGVLGNDTDSDGGPKVIASASDPAHGTVAITGGGSGLTYRPDADYCNTPPGSDLDTFTYTLNGGSTATVTMTVTCVDDAPVAVDDAETVAEDDPATAVDVLANDTDVDAGPITITSITQPANGTVAMTGIGTGLTYAPDANYCNDADPASVDTFTYTLNGGSAGTVSMTVTCVADPPTLTTSAGPAAYTENAAAAVVDDGVTILNPDGVTIDGGSVELTGNAEAADALAWTDNDPDDTITEGVSSAHTVVLTGDGTAAQYAAALQAVTYESTSDNPSTLPRTVTFSVSTSAGPASDTIGIQVIAVDDPPAAVADSTTVLEDAAATAVPVLTNDTDVDAGPRTIASASNPADGTVALTGGEPGAHTGLTYQPDPNFCTDPPGTTPDTFTYTLNGGSTATVSVTVTCVNDAPVADDETFSAASSAVGNTELVVNDSTDGAPANPRPHKGISGDLLAGDTDIDGPGPLVVVPGTITSNDGGTVVLEADGDFTYTPAAATSCTDTSDFFDYTVTDQDTPTAGTDTGRVTIAITDCVWYVDNTATGDDAGTSAEPFATLAQAQAASGIGDTIFVFAGDGTTTGYASGIDLLAAQRLIGEIADLTVGSDMLWTGAPGARPAITADGADVVVLAAGNTVRGLLIDPQGTGGGIAGGPGDASGTIADVRIVDTGTAGTQPALELDGTSGSFAISDLVVDNAAATGQTSGSIGVRLNNAGTVGFASPGTISIKTKGAKGLDATGTNLGLGSVFDDITVTGSGTGAVSMTTTTGTTTFSNLDLTTTSGATGAFVLNNAGTVTVSAAGTANISATGGPAVDVTGTAGAVLDLDTVTSTNSAGDGVNLGGLAAGTFSANFTSAITNAAAVAFDLDGGAGAVTYNGSITDDLGQLVRVQNTTGGVKDFNGAITDGDDGDGSGIALTSNTGATIRFDGGLTLATGANPALAATGGGTVVVTDPNAVGTVPDNTLTTTTGIALNVNAVTIGGNGLNFRSISSNGATNGIALVNTGTSGGLTVSGTGPTGSGGTIQNTSSDAILLTSVKGVSLTDVNVTSSQESGILGSSVTDLDLTDVKITGSGNDSADAGIKIVNLLGTADWTNLTATGSALANVYVTNSSGTLSALNVTGASHFDSLGTMFGGNSFLVEMTGTAVMGSGLVDGATFQDNKPARGISVQAQGDGTIGTSGNAFVVQNSTFTNNGLHASFEQSGTADLTFKLLGNGSAAVPMTMPNTAVGTSHAVNVFTSSNSTGGTIRGRIVGNRIGNSGVAGSGSAIGNGIRALIQGMTQATLVIDSNIVTQTPQARGIDVQLLGPLSPSAGPTSDVTVTNNSVTPFDSTGFPASAIYLAADSQGGGPVISRFDVRGNTVPLGAAVDALPAYLIVDEVAAGAQCLLVDTAPASSTATEQLLSTNTGSSAGAAGCALFAGPIGTPP
jgi:VCBS repeat-containing protein